jgi:aryl-alcohol dehydrogenase-like predicted oxidoreductase
MQNVALGDSGLSAPQLGFGCSALLGRSDKTDSLQALTVAWDEGVRFFDTARSYGYGESEALLGQFLQGRRKQAIIATKFGIVAARQTGLKRIAKAAARKILAVAPAIQPLLQKRARGEFSHNQFTIPVLVSSLEESLRKLGTDYVDMLFFHAAPASVLEQHDLLDALARLVESGKVRVAGLSAEPCVIELAMENQTPHLRAFQFPRNVFNASASTNIIERNKHKYALVANHPYGGVAKVRRCKEILLTVLRAQSIDPVLGEKLGTLEDTVFADIVLNVILRDSGIHIVVPAMMRAKHIRANVSAITNSRFTSQEIAHIRHLLAKNEPS